jgi:hypothetical protein
MNKMENNHLLDELQKDQHEKIGNSYSSWNYCATRLLIAADILKEKLDSAVPTLSNLSQTDDSILQGVMVNAPQLMLRGFAIECLLKGLWVKRGNLIVVYGKY